MAPIEAETPKKAFDDIEAFKDCALIEIIHLHECLRGALRALEADVKALFEEARLGSTNQTSLERKVTGRFQVIWSVFRSHSSAEDEFIWPALQRKTQGRISGHAHHHDEGIEQEEYEEDHADEERMFSAMDRMLTELRESRDNPDGTTSALAKIGKLLEHTSTLSGHLMQHLRKEETQCIPLVAEHLSKEEIHELVGQIMGKRSADTIAQIMTMAVQSLEEKERHEMIKYMKQAMSGTFFDRWLHMSGWMSSQDQLQDPVAPTEPTCAKVGADSDGEDGKDDEDRKRPAENDDGISGESKRPRVIPLDEEEESSEKEGGEYTSPGELEKFIRAIATNPALTSAQKNSTIQGLRDSVWKSNMKRKALLRDAPTTVNSNSAPQPMLLQSEDDGHLSVASSSSTRRVTPPSMYFKKRRNGKIQLAWTSDSQHSSSLPVDVPLFSAAELAPTYNDGAARSVLGCPHYARGCKLRHPKSGRLYTCRLCCEQHRELPSSDPEDSLDRFAVREVMCLKCHCLQPAEDRCLNKECESRGKPFAKYFCKICHLYDDAPDKPIFHCPYCNTCRLGKGLGIDFRHCMRCNACVSLSDDNHQCLPQKLQGDCPICHESLFQSTEPLRGLKCGHVMHMSCFTQYRRGHSYTCPLCMRSMEDMSEYFAMLDTAIRMQPMPSVYLSTMSNIYCQDCGQTGQVQYHFVGLKCQGCGSYNTREMGRVDVSSKQSS